MPDAARKQATLRYVKYLSTKTNTPLTHGYIIHMAYASREARLRAFNEDTQRLVNLHSGAFNDIKFRISRRCCD